MLVGEASKKKRKIVEFDQQEMFPAEFHEHYKVISHHMMIENGESYWASSTIMWRIKEEK